MMKRCHSLVVQFDVLLLLALACPIQCSDRAQIPDPDCRMRHRLH